MTRTPADGGSPERDFTAIPLRTTSCCSLAQPMQIKLAKCNLEIRLNVGLRRLRIAICARKVPKAYTRKTMTKPGKSRRSVEVHAA